VTHLGDRIAALADGELDHAERDRALAHVAGCPSCRAALEEQRAVRALLSSSAAPEPAPETMAALLSLAAPGGPLPPRSRRMPQGPVVPELPPPRRLARPWGARGDGHRPTRQDSRRPGDRAARRVRVATAGALSVAGLVLGTAFVAGGSAGAEAPVVPPVSQLSVEHGRTATAVTVGDPGLGLMTGLTGVPSSGGATSQSRR
jgi:anti-sigma factor RsiW